METLVLGYFDPVVAAHVDSKQLGEDGTDIAVATNNPPVEARLCLPVYELCGDAVPVDVKRGYSLHFRFEPHDLGKVAFRREPLVIDKGELVVNRYGRSIRFRRVHHSAG